MGWGVFVPTVSPTTVESVTQQKWCRENGLFFWGLFTVEKASHVEKRLHSDIPMKQVTGKRLFACEASSGWAKPVSWTVAQSQNYGITHSTLYLIDLRSFINFFTSYVRFTLFCREGKLSQNISNSNSYQSLIAV